MVDEAMLDSAWLYFGLLTLIAGERLVELRISQRNAAWAMAQGGLEAGQRHFFWMKLLHTGLFFACAAEVFLAQRPFLPGLGYAMLALVGLAQALRYWAITSLGRFWNVRVIVVPKAKPITRGPYKYLRHPNYVAVIIEGIAIPLVHTAYLTALSFTLLNAVLLWVRIRCEEQTLASHCEYGAAFANKYRFVPRGDS